MGAGDEFLLFCQKDFEDPESSQTLQVLKQIKDNESQSLALLLFSSIYCSDLCQIPSLAETQIPQITSKQASANSASSWLTDYVNLQTTAQTSATQSNSSIPGFSWILDYMKPMLLYI